MWYAQEEYWTSLAEHNIGEKELMLYDRIALERHDHTATKAERTQNTKHWVLCLNADGPQGRYIQVNKFVNVESKNSKAEKKTLGSVFIFNIAVARLTMANELEFMAFHIILVVISVSWKEFQKIDGRVDSTPTNTAHTARDNTIMRMEQG